MALFLSKTIENEKRVTSLQALWCPTEAVLAVARSDNVVSLVGDDGDPFCEQVLKRSVHTTVMQWRPGARMLVVGWMDGMLSVWNLAEGAAAGRRELSQHREPISSIQWSDDGARLVTADRGGSVCVWAADGRGRLRQVALYEQERAVKHVVFAELEEPEELKAAATELAEAAADAPSRRKRSSSMRKAPKVYHFFYGGDSGVVAYADDLENTAAVISLGRPIESLKFLEAQQKLVILGGDVMVHLHVAPDASCKVLMKAKVSMVSESRICNVIWAGPGVIALASFEHVIRFYDVAHATAYRLSASAFAPTVPRGDRVQCIAFNASRRILAAGTRDGFILMWRFRGAAIDVNDGESRVPDDDDWEPMPPITVEEEILSLHWGPLPGLLVATIPSGLSVLNESVLQRKLAGQLAAVQLSATSVQLERLPEGREGREVMIADCGVRVRAMDVDSDHFVVWNGKAAEVYAIEAADVRLMDTLETNAVSIALSTPSLFMAVDSRIDVCNLSGTPRATLSFTEEEGMPLLLDIKGKYLAVATSSGLIKVYDVGRREPKARTSGIRFEDPLTGEPLGVVRSIRVNAAGNRVSILADARHGAYLRMPDSKLYVYNADIDAIQSYDFAPRLPISHSWDSEEARLLACETQATGAESRGDDNDDDDKEAKAAEEESKDDGGRKKPVFKSDINVHTLFSTNDYGLRVQDTHDLPSGCGSLLGIAVPKLHYVTTAGSSGAGGGGDDDAATSAAARGLAEPLVKSRMMRDFVGLDSVDDETRAALLNFSYFLTIEKLDDAYRAVKRIDNPLVWENMASMCVKTKRMDVAEVCLGNMGHARGAKALREARSEQEPEAAVAMVAIQLGLLKDAARLYRECGRYDLLNRMYQACGKWDSALALARKHDRIHLRTTHFQYARHWESLGELRRAIKHYEESGTHAREVPRMLFNGGTEDELEAYVNRKADKKLFAWWAGYCESLPDYERALYYHRKAGDQLGVVRVLCQDGAFDDAHEVVFKTGSKAAAFHVARQHEMAGRTADAIEFYRRAGRYNHAIRLAKEEGEDGELLKLAIVASPDLQVDAAAYFEAKGLYDKAVQLYQKGGQVSKALDLCFRAELFEELRSIADELGNDTSPEVLVRCAEFFMDHGQYEKAMHLFVLAHRYQDALNLAMDHKIKVSPEMAERMTLPKRRGMSEEESNRRTKTLVMLALTCEKQGQFQLACQKYTQAGFMVKGMKCLLQSGDTEKIIFYAGRSRKREVYFLAAHYLQALDWHTDPEIMKAIITFYTKAKSFDQLSSFYDDCAQVEIDDYRDYEKGLVALKEALTYLGRSQSPEKEDEMSSLQQRIYLVERFVQARKLQKSDPAEMVKICRQLLNQPDIDSAVRVGDVYALLVVHFYNSRAEDSMRQAFQLISDMRERGIDLDPYLDHDLITDVYRALGRSPPPAAGATGDDYEDDGVDVEIGMEV
eukprot:PLAT12468.31.p1 GENE.PLAT12468.31~~PLAT12468.31.p1  ORF type:complete len:1453 (-),score=862.37 PLAT12468.31:92-4450(-)